MEDDLRKVSRERAVAALNLASAAPKSRVSMLFSDVYDELPPMLQEQQDNLLDHMARYEQHYQQWDAR